MMVVELMMNREWWWETEIIILVINPIVPQLTITTSPRDPPFETHQFFTYALPNFFLYEWGNFERS